MKTKIENLKKCFITSLVFMSSVFGMSMLSGQDVVTVSHANNLLTSWIDIEITGDGENITLEGDSADGEAASVLNAIIKIIQWLSLIGSFIIFGVFVLNIIKIGTAGTNVQARASAQQGLVWSAIGAALLTVSTVIFFFIQNVFK